tara:strand:- start:303 stop:512 length:210 start_codon:yes stop_codon:yes gene_type:complete
MQVGDLVRPRAPRGGVTPLVEQDWVGVVVDFIERGSREYVKKYAVVCWNEEYPQEEEHMQTLEVISAEG